MTLALLAEAVFRSGWVLRHSR